jgi:LysR family glycine cleavage system transcriptional activator
VTLPSLNALHAFVVTARTGSVAAAAKELHVTPSAVSHQIKRLEESLGLRLLQRSNKKISLTALGATYHEAVSAAFDAIGAATERLDRQRKPVVAITTVPPFALKWLVRRLPSFHQKHPEVEVRIGTTYRLVDLRHGDYDLAVRFGLGKWPGLHARRLMGETVEPVCSPGYLRSAKKPLRVPADVSGHALLSTRIVRGDWPIWAEVHGVEPPRTSKRLEFEESFGAIQAAIDGLGVALGPTVLVHDDVKSGLLVAPLNVPIRLREAYYVTYGDHALENAAARVFLDWLIATSEEFERSLPKPERSVGAGAIEFPRLDG